MRMVNYCHREYWYILNDGNPQLFFFCCVIRTVYQSLYLCSLQLCCVFLSREHLSEEDLRKNKAMLEGLTKGQLVDNPEVTYNMQHCIENVVAVFDMLWDELPFVCTVVFEVINVATYGVKH